MSLAYNFHLYFLMLSLVVLYHSKNTAILVEEISFLLLLNH